MSKGKKRFWSDDERREICRQARLSGASVALVARRYAMNANLIHKWLSDPQFAAAEGDVDATFEASVNGGVSDVSAYGINMRVWISLPFFVATSNCIFKLQQWRAISALLRCNAIPEPLTRARIVQLIVWVA